MSEPTIGRREIRRRIYGALASMLTRAAIIDEDDPDFIDLCYSVQLDMAKEFASKSQDPTP